MDRGGHAMGLSHLLGAGFLSEDLSRLLTAVHFLALGGVGLYGLHRLRFFLFWAALRKGGTASAPARVRRGEADAVTVQIPLYNERFVAARAIDAACRLRWPRELLEIQILDDSTDDTREIIDERCSFWRRSGVDIKVLRREHRTGFKAGALAEGLSSASGVFIAILDADFLPPPDFLEKTIPAFADPGVGMVQAKWGFTNTDHSWLTRIQSLLLGPHFGIEHYVRFRRGLFFNFNGTAGVWRKLAIETSGGWQADTVTEDLDLSYRAQLHGWRFVYLDDVIVPSELPSTLCAFRSQQKRWAKGSLQTARKLLPLVLRSPSISTEKKLEAAFHLLGNLGWLLGTVVMLTLFPAIVWRVGVGPYQLLRLDLPLFACGAGAILLYFYLYARKDSGNLPALWVPLIPVLTIGLAPSLSLAVLEGAFTRGGFFERTPKFGILGRESLPGMAFLYRQGISTAVVVNTLLLCYSLVPVLFSLNRGTWVALPFLLLFSFGFLLVLAKEVSEGLRRGAPPAAVSRAAGKTS